MPRSKANTGRKGTETPPEMARMAERLGRVYRDRKAKWGLTQKQLAEASGVSQSVISELMNEELPPRDGVTAAVVVNLCRALEVDPSFVLIGKGDLIPAFARATEAARVEPVDISEDVAPLAPAPTPPEPSATRGRKGRTPRARTSESP